MRYGAPRLAAVAGLFLTGVLLTAPAAAAPTSDSQAGPVTDADPQEQFALARELAASGDVGAAEDAWRRGLEKFGDEPYARLEYGRYLARRGEVRQAATQFLKAVDLDPDNSDLLWACGVFLRRHPDAVSSALEESESLLRRLVELRPGDDRAWLELGILAISRQDYDRASEAFARARDLAPYNIAASGYLAESLVRGERHEEAEQVLRDLLNKDAMQLRARMALTRIYVERNNLEAAIEVLRAVPAEQASDPGVRRRLAFLLADVSRVDEAAELTSTLLADSPDDLELRKLAVRLESVSGRYEDAAELLRDYVRATPEDINAVLELVEYLEMLGREDEAVATLERSRTSLAEDSADRRRLSLKLLDLLGRRGDWAEVLVATEPWIEQQVDSDSPDWTVFPLHAEALHHDQGLRSARKFLERLADRESSLRPAVQAKDAELLLAAGREWQARRVLDDLTALEGPLGPSLAARVWAIRDRPVEALPAAREAAHRAPQDIDLRFQLASYLDAAGLWPEAEQELLGVLAAQPDHAPSLNYLGYEWADRGADLETLERALDMTRRAVELNPDNGAYQDSLGWVYFKLGRYQKARPHLERAAALIVNDPVILEHLGDLYRAIGDHGRARAFYSWAVKMDSDNPDLSGKLGQLSEDG